MPAAIKDQRGFTLIELLVVILIMGILVAIAIPNFLNQREKAQDTEAKSNARSLVEHVESCYADTQDFTKCGPDDLGSTGLALGTGAGQVTVSANGANEYVVTAYSKSGGQFSITRTNHKSMVRTCTGDTAGCSNGKW